MRLEYEYGSIRPEIPFEWKGAHHLIVRKRPQCYQVILFSDPPPTQSFVGSEIGTVTVVPVKLESSIDVTRLHVHLVNKIILGLFQRALHIHEIMGS